MSAGLAARRAQNGPAEQLINEVIGEVLPGAHVQVITPHLESDSYLFTIGYVVQTSIAVTSQQLASGEWGAIVLDRTREAAAEVRKRVALQTGLVEPEGVATDD
jgi:hypothetical protein